MLLKNFGALLANALADDSITEGIKCTTGELPASTTLKTMPSSRTSMGRTVNTAAYTANSASGGNASWAFGFGDGTTPPTIDDYKFSGTLVEPSRASTSTSNGSNGATFQMVAINQTEEAMTIKEIGLFSSSTAGCVMVTRDVLPEPVVLEPGASKGFQIYIDTQSFIANASQV